jgi:hypothetical protein
LCFRGRVAARDVVAACYVGILPSGQRTEVRGCDLFNLRDGKVLRKDTYLNSPDPRKPKKQIEQVERRVVS